MRSKPVPSVKTLTEIGIDDEKARLLRCVLKLQTCVGAETMIGSIRQPGPFPKTVSWRMQLCGSPSLVDVQMQLANEIIEGCGVEHCGEVDMRNGPPLLYINLGDTYQATLCRFRGRFIVSSWGDVVERHPKLFE